MTTIFPRFFISFQFDNTAYNLEKHISPTSLVVPETHDRSSGLVVSRSEDDISVGNGEGSSGESPTLADYSSNNTPEQSKRSKKGTRKKDR